MICTTTGVYRILVGSIYSKDMLVVLFFGFKNDCNLFNHIVSVRRISMAKSKYNIIFIELYLFPKHQYMLHEWQLQILTVISNRHLE